MAARGLEKPVIERPRRPVLVEVAAAILIVGSAMDVLLSFESMTNAPTALGRALAATSVSVSLLLVILGYLLRKGRAWLVALNVAAVAAFLELQSLSLVGILGAVFDMTVVGILLRERWWFQWRPPTELGGAVAQAAAGENDAPGELEGNPERA